ncbi:MAG: Gfo/Idh/MocA family oxidoreductase [Flavobacterium sp.]|nr:Gfo/Idh/MocA family oxidoreductase [Aeromicrobium sp.]
MSKLKIGVLGAARISEKSLAGPANRGGHRLVVVAARDRGRAQAFADRHGVERVADSYADVIADPEVDLVYNPLANGLHAPWNIKALRAGKAVLSEKPFAANADEARRVADVVRETGGTIMEAFHYATHPVMLRLQEIVASGEIGALRHIESTMIIPAPADDDPRWSLKLAGGALMDLGCYSLHAIRTLSHGGEPVVRSARGVERPGHPGVDEWIQAELELPGGATASVFTSMAGPDVVMTLTAIGSTGRVDAMNFVLPHEDDRVRVVTADGDRTESMGTRSSYDYQLDAVAAAVLGGAALPLDVDDAVATMELVDATYLAAGFPVRPSSVD